MWENFVNFLKENDITTLAQNARSLDWGQVVTNPLFWLVLIVFLAWVVWKKQFKLLLLLASAGAFVFLLQVSLPPSGDKIELNSLIKFLGGAVVIIGLNLYVFLIKGD
jgi:hypothetical protein